MAEERDKFREMCLAQDDDLDQKHETICDQLSQIYELQDYDQRIRKRIMWLERQIPTDGQKPQAIVEVVEGLIEQEESKVV